VARTAPTYTSALTTSGSSNVADLALSVSGTIAVDDLIFIVVGNDSISTGNGITDAVFTEKSSFSLTLQNLRY
jgi:hypothetical protein